MNKKDKLELIIEDDKRVSEERKSNIETVLNGPILGQNRVDHPFQYETISAGESNKLVYRNNVGGKKALIIKQIANEWYPDTVFELNIDGNKNTHERRISDPEEPLDTTMLVRDKIEWRVTNNSNTDRTIGILSDGFYVPREVYESIKDSYASLGIDIEARSVGNL